MKSKTRYNIKETIYLSRELSDAISDLADRKNLGFNATVRYLLENGLKYEG